MKILLLNFYQSPENFHFEQAMTRNINKLKNINLDIAHNFNFDFSPLASTKNLKGIRKHFSQIKSNKNYDAVISIDFPWKMDSSNPVYVKLIKSARKKIMIMNHLTPSDKDSPFYEYLKKRDFFLIFDAFYFYAFDSCALLPDLKKNAIRFRNYYIDSLYYSPSKKCEFSENITFFIAGSKERNFDVIEKILKLDKRIKVLIMSNSQIKIPSNYKKRALLLNLNENIFKIKENIEKSDIVFIPINDASLNPTAGMAVCFMGMSMEKPVLMKSRKWIKDYLIHKKNGYLYKSINEIEKNIKTVLNDKKNWLKIGEEARKTILKKASLDNFVLQILKENLSL